MKEGKVTLQNDWNTWKFETNDISDVCFLVWVVIIYGMQEVSL
jgi:hypothetical protein